MANYNIVPFILKKIIRVILSIRIERLTNYERISLSIFKLIRVEKHFVIKYNLKSSIYFSICLDWARYKIFINRIRRKRILFLSLTFNLKKPIQMHKCCIIKNANGWSPSI
jgi:hypothetical protein